MAYFETFNPFVDKVPEWPFKRLDDVMSRAAAIVRHLSAEQLAAALKSISSAIEHQKLWYVEVETEMYVDRLVTQGGWELKYMPANTAVTRESVIELLNNWPRDADDEPDIPREVDFSDVFALQDALDRDEISTGLNYPVSTSEECFAILALMKVDETLRFLGWSKGMWNKRPTEIARESLCVAGSEAIAAMEALGLAERASMLALERNTLLKSNTVMLEAEKRSWAESRAKVNSARLLAGKHKANRERREIVETWYDEHRSDLDEDGTQRYTSDDDIATDIAESSLVGVHVPEKFRTVRKWIAEHKKTRL